MSKLRPPTAASSATKIGGGGGNSSYGFKVGDRVSVNDGEKSGFVRFIGKIKASITILIRK
jgi:hypothetical protein